MQVACIHPKTIQVYNMRIHLHHTYTRQCRVPDQELPPYSHTFDIRDPTQRQAAFIIQVLLSIVHQLYVILHVHIVTSDTGIILASKTRLPAKVASPKRLGSANSSSPHRASSPAKARPSSSPARTLSPAKVHDYYIPYLLVQ